MKLGRGATSADQLRPPQSWPWIAAAILGIQLLHALHLPVTLGVAGPVLVLLSFLIDRRRWRPPSLALVAAALLAVLAVRSELGYLIGREPGVAFLCIAAGIKLMELRTRRDVSFMLCLAAFLLPTVFFYGHTIPTTLAVVAVALVILGAFVAVRDTQAPVASGPALRLAGLLMLQGLPAALALFMLFPRLSGPLWSLPTERVGRTGLSDRMDPGSVTRLSLSDDVAFRVDFEGPVPHSRELYWRGPVLTHFDGRGWSTTLVPGEGRVLVEAEGAIAYHVSLEPHDQFWLFALDLAASIPPQARISREQQLLSKTPVTQAMQYRQTSVLGDRYPAVHLDELRHALALPPGSNRRTREWAAALRRQSTTPLELINAVLANFRKEKFYYTLNPPEYGPSGIDAFLFDQRRGFCEHYAGAFTFVMRAAGIPARVVTGYQGGEVSPVGGYLIVRQADAHAWAEVWVDNVWRRIDPTAAVAPERIERGLSAALPEGERVPLLAQLDQSLAKSLRLHWDAVNYRWQRWVVEFNRERQQLLWKNLGLPRPQPWQVVAALVALGGLWLGMLALWLLRRRRRDPAQRAWEKFCAQLARGGLPRPEHEAPIAYARRAAKRWPAAAELIERVALAYCRARYGARRDSHALAELKLAVAALRGNKAFARR